MDQRERGWFRRGLARSGVRLVALFCTGLLLSSCASAIGVGVAAGLVGVALVTHRCYDYLDVTVYDSFGRKTCAPEVVVERNGGSTSLTSCYYTPLSDGTYTLRARYPGLPDVTSTVIVDHASGCSGHVQSAALTLTGPVGPPPPQSLPYSSPTGALPPPPPPPAAIPTPAPVQAPATPAPKPAPAAAPVAPSPPSPAPSVPAPATSSSAPPSAAFPALPK